MNERGALSRFHEPIHLIGVGGIGSVVLPVLARMAPPELVLWDHDKVEPHNLDYQLIYRPEDIGSYKVDAAAAYLKRQGLAEGVELTLRRERVTKDHAGELSGIVILAVDSMKARFDITAGVLYNPAVVYMLDGRTGGPQLDCFCIEPNVPAQADFYQDLLFPDSAAMPLPCGTRDDSDAAGTVGRMITRAVKQYALSVLDKDVRSPSVVRTQMHLDSMQIVVAYRGDLMP